MAILIESCSHLSIGMIKKDLRFARDKKAGINGVINIEYGQVKAMADYYIEYGDEYDYLVIHYGETEQRIKLAICELHFGTRSYFICECGRRVGKLYFPPHGKSFKCRHKLAYELTCFNRKSRLGRLGYVTNRKNKLINMREGIPRLFHKNRYTKRFVRFLDLCKRAGEVGEIMAANHLLEAMNAV